MENSYLDFLGKQFLKHNFLGVFPRDCLPTHKIKVEKPYSLIINMDKSKDPGSHFVLMYVKHQNIYYFDSYGFGPLHQEILDFKKKQKCSLSFNVQQIQSENSYFCGLFCFGFLLAKDRKISTSDFLKLFYKSNSNLDKNDEIIQNFIVESLGIL